MARIELRDLAHAYGPRPEREEDYALKRADFAWEDGGAYALLGPSGCGKTTMLNIISGLVRPSEGRVLFDGKDVTGLSPAARNIAQVFQFPVVYDTMSVGENLAFPLKNRGLPRAEIEERVREVAHMLELSPMLHQRAAGLAADAKQKISVGRGLVRSDVAAILFDEPLTVIDPHLKWRLRRNLKEIHARFRRTLVYVTHDQNEALTFADKVVVMHEGQIVQTGTPQELFEEPAHRFVGFFIGSPGMNFLPVEGDAAGLRLEGTTIVLGHELAAQAGGRSGRLELGIRPEFLELHETPVAEGIEAAVTEVQDLGNFKLATLRLGPHLLKAKLHEDAAVPQARGWLRLPPARTRLYAEGRLIG
ncbi:ABC transporter ATP-binding protein [Geminicoccaceae bacterium 1502E]|nr:ABC transporter ATP-binding protein [Geminicoccaceae bacterium 1502E]